MKKGAIIRLIIWSAVALLLTAILAAAMLTNGRVIIANGFGIELGLESLTYTDSDSYTVYDGPVSISDSITSLNIEWISGNVEISVYDGNTVEVEETDVSDSAERLRYRVKSGTLDIRFRKSSVLFGISNMASKKLTVKIPAEMAQNMRSITVETVSAPVAVTDINVSGDINIDTTSGDVSLDGVTASALDFDSTSGSLKFEGSISEIESDTVSGEIQITSSTLPRSVESDSVSGNFTLTVPDNGGFSAEFDSVSGKFSCDFETVRREDEYIYQNGGAEFEFSTLSGDVTINKQ